MDVNSEFVSNEILKSDVQFAKHDESMIWTWQGIVTDLNCANGKTQPAIRVTLCVPASKGKKPDEGTMALRSLPKINWVAVVDSPEPRIQMTVIGKESSDILINLVLLTFTKIENFICPGTYRSVFVAPAGGLAPCLVSTRMSLFSRRFLWVLSVSGCCWAFSRMSHELRGKSSYNLSNCALRQTPSHAVLEAVVRIRTERIQNTINPSRVIGQYPI
jgi:hypothetical protein